MQLDPTRYQVYFGHVTETYEDGGAASRYLGVTVGFGGTPQVPQVGDYFFPISSIAFAPTGNGDLLQSESHPIIFDSFVGDGSGPAGSYYLRGGVLRPTAGTLTFAPGSCVILPHGHLGGSGVVRTTDNGCSCYETPVGASFFVSQANQAPTAVDDAATTDEDTAVTIAALANDTDPDGDPLSASLASGPAHGVVAQNADGSFTYAPAGDFNGQDSFTYTANDGKADSNFATVTIDVAAVNDTSVAAADVYGVDEDQTLSRAAPGVLGNDSDPDGDALTAVLVSPPSNGALTLARDGSFVYTPNANYNGPDGFTYQASDGVAAVTASVHLVVASVNDPPTAVNDSALVNPNSTSNQILVLANDTTAPDLNESLRVTSVTPPANGAVTIEPGGFSVFYTTRWGFSGTDGFTYTVSDGNGGNATAVVTVTVRRLLADLALVLSGPPTAFVGVPFDYRLFIRNDEPDPARNVGVIDDLPPFLLSSATTTHGSCRHSVRPALLNCDLGTLEVGELAEVVISITPPATLHGITFQNRAWSLSNSLDPDRANNFATVRTTIDHP